MTTGHNLKLRLFIEGIEVPVISASVDVVPNAPAAASIQVIATNKVLNLYPRTVVHLFFYDFVDASSTLSPVNPTASEMEFDAKTYKLLFMGELQTLSFQKDSGSRSVVLKCVDFSNYWDTTYQYNFQGSLFGGRRHAAFIGANANLLTSPLGHGVGTFAAMLNGKSVNYPNLKGLLAGIVRTLEAIGGSYYGDDTFKGANDFTSIAELRLKILRQITAAEDDDSTAKLFARKAFNMWMNRRMGSLGKLVTFRGVLALLQRFIFHEVYACPTARFVPREDGLTKRKVWSVSVASDPHTKGFVTKLYVLERLFKSLQSNLSKAYNPVSKSSDIPAITRDYSVLARTIKEMAVSGYPKMFRSGMSIVSDSLKGVHEAVFSGSSADSKKVYNSIYYNQAFKKCDKAIIAIIIMLRKRIHHAKDVSYDRMSRVNNQILRPDVWFAPAPRNNVLFPELYSGFSWSRNFFREVSRMELQTTHEILGDHALFNGRYYAPNVEDMRSGIKLSSRKFKRLILQHELMTGIIPMFEKITEANLFAMKARKVKYKGAKVGYAQRAVNFQYFTHRFASRQLSVRGRFNPWFVAGFPAVIIDRPMDNDNLVMAGLTIPEQLSKLGLSNTPKIPWTRARILREIVPSQFVGTCVQLNHTVSQAGGNTQYAFTHARVHRETTEYLGVDKAPVSKRVGTGSRTRVYATDVMYAPKVGSTGPHGGKITFVADVTETYYGRWIQKLYQPGYAHVGVEVTDSVPAPGTPQGSENYHAYKIKESFYRRVVVSKIDLPIEDAVRPPWIWDGWTNLKIGETYQRFFGTGSIVDVDGYSDVDALTTNFEGSDTYAALLETKEGKKTVTHGPNEKDPEDTDFTTTAGKKISAATILAITEDKTVEASIDFIVRLYSFMKYHNMDVGMFLKNYTWRPIASMVDILGSKDLLIRETSPDVFEAVRGREGFHSRAFSDEKDLFGLVDKQVTRVLGLSKKKNHAAAKRLDVRSIRRSVVREYVEELTKSKGLLG